MAALDGLAGLGRVLAVSSLWETEPVGGPEQGDYLNAVVVVGTPLGPVPLVRACLEIERGRGRERDNQAMPRTLDLDVLLYGDATIGADEVTVPHPRMHLRRFVLEPLHEAWPGAEIPGLGPVAELLGSVADQRCVRVAGPEWARSGE